MVAYVEEYSGKISKDQRRDFRTNLGFRWGGKVKGRWMLQIYSSVGSFPQTSMDGFLRLTPRSQKVHCTEGEKTHWRKSMRTTVVMASRPIAMIGSGQSSRPWNLLQYCRRAAFKPLSYEISRSSTLILGLIL